VSGDLLKLTAYFGERDRTGGRFLAEVIAAAFVRHRLELGVVLRGIGGFGVEHHLRDDRRLTLAEDLPLVAVGLDAPGPVEGALSEIAQLGFDGMLTLERARSEEPIDRGGDAVKLTLYVGRHERRGGESLYRSLTARLDRAGFATVIVLLGVDGSVGGQRRRARFLSANADVPLMLIAVGQRTALAPALEEIHRLLPQPRLSVERVRICRQAGVDLATPPAPPPASRGELWQKLMIHTGGSLTDEGTALHLRLLHVLRLSGARGATTLRGVWGSGNGRVPHGDRLLQLRRRVPLVTVWVDRPERIAALYPQVAALAGEGLVTSEWVPAVRASGPGISLGSLDLAEL
jgi:PII-like signaling protein